MGYDESMMRCGEPWDAEEEQAAYEARMARYERETARTLAEYREAMQRWNDAGRPGGRLGRPVLDCLGTCETCGGLTTTEIGMLPAFKKINLCQCKEKAS